MVDKVKRRACKPIAKRAQKGEYVLSYVNHFWNTMEHKFSAATDAVAVRTAKTFIANERGYWKKDCIRALGLVKKIPLN